MQITIARWHVALALYLIVVGAIVLIRPALMFDAEGKVKPWGLDTEAGESVFAVQVVFPILAVLIYYIVVLSELSVS